MNNTATITNLVVTFGMYLPYLLISIVAVVLLRQKRAMTPKALTWALAGFGLLLFVSLAAPISQIALRTWVFSARDPAPRVWMFAALAGATMLLHATCYICLLLAILAAARPSSTRD